MFIVFGPIAIVIWIVVLVVFASTKVACTVPVMLVLPEQVILADIPVGVSTTFVIWQSPVCGLLVGPPYLSIIACVTQTWLVRAGICGMPAGPPVMLMLDVTSQSPGFLLCPCAIAASAIAQQHKVHTRTLFIDLSMSRREGKLFPNPSRLI
jgi:hypothetical protein